ncbi:bifunctional serine/threonine-protein kinase/formylglycine-generating enzyme family protein [Dolichospermum planctonicum CS-1226]|uniref:Bifunctional serine/threonine-protein kinase/formylglycine-generating enzyme family protein n=1 Tax=Dolichospermum planctonicum CS-1226 TaxID=3021751 RepID=A0ABT5ACN4_9CYAN|nr:bifunctional serine/threonine-protein kinase/formylglycine-generating enzyme family protein [Dolichospermum planctonicum]MDB9534654.1 bifunctional serine/threonine-protein kinase/formylglycine-generating enzyme family protein [Dolichospermum planctonicum CS-1226]
MSLCINPNCLKPENPDNILFCQACGSELILQGRYRAIIELGRGGFGVTYQINEIGKNQTKVLKVLTNNQPKAIELFKQEAAVLSQLNHPGIPKVETDAYFVYFPHESRNPIHCFVMENIEGIDLEKYMQNRKDGIKQLLAIYLLKDLVIILEQVHNQNFFHRDIKPSNIMLRAENAQPVLIDFGTVRQVTETVVNQSGQVTSIVSAGYTPPEQINNNAVPQSDFFALGRTFVYLLTGKKPLDPAIYDYNNEILNWRSHAPQISPMLADLLDDMMQRLYKDRPQNIKQISQRLAAIEKALQEPQIKPQPQKNKFPRRVFIKTGLIIGTFTIAVAGKNIFKNLFNNQDHKPTTPKTTTSINSSTPELTTSPNPTPENTTSLSNLKTFKFEVVTTDPKGNITNRRNATAKYFTEDLGNGVFLEMVKIPGGKFLMGSLANEAKRSDNESPQHQVTVPSFWIGKYQLTQEQYQAIIGTNPAYFKGNKRPVERVSWNDAVTFCQRLSQRTGKHYRLPSEAEWEYACRGETTTPFYFGETITPELVNYDGNHVYESAPKGQYRNQTTNVGDFPPNAFGLYDMHGNVWEWCQDDWHDNYTNAPEDGTAWISQSGNAKILRGGSWGNNPDNSRSAYRNTHSFDYNLHLIGFRVVCGGVVRVFS